MPGLQNGNAHTANEVEHANLMARKIPTLEYTVQNILITVATLAGTFFTLIFTVTVILPLSIVRMLIPKQYLTLSLPDDTRMRGKAVLIVGASRGIGLEILKQYVSEPDTSILAASEDTDELKGAITRLGDTPATIQTETIDLSSSTKDIAHAVRRIDNQYGPISHLYAISEISDHPNDGDVWNMTDVTEKMIQDDASGTIALTIAMYERMKTRKYGKICIVGSVAGIYSPANMISYASTKTLIDTFSSSLRTLGSAYNVEVVTVQPGFIDTHMTQKMRGQGSVVPDRGFASAEEIARKMKLEVEKGGVGVVWPMRQSVMMNVFKGMNPICEELGRFLTMAAYAVKVVQNGQ